MHFSRNPSGPNTSCIKDFADSLAAAAAAPSGLLPAAVGSSSKGTCPPSAVFAALLTFAPTESAAELDARFARNPPFLSPIETEGPVTITYPLPSLRQRPTLGGWTLYLLIQGVSRTEQITSFYSALPLSDCVTLGNGDFERFPFQGASANQLVVGCHMNRSKSLSYLPVLLLAALSLTAATYVADLTRLQSDSAFLGQVLANVPAGTYNKITVNVTGAVVTYCTDLGGVVGCDAASVNQVSQTAATMPSTSSFSATLTSGQKTGFQIQFSFANAVTINSTQPQVVSKVDLGAANVLTASALPPTSSSLATGQLDFVEDVTGVVTAASASSVTVKTSSRGSMTAALNQSTFLVSNCVTTNATCAPAVGQFASIDTSLNADGTFTALEYDPIAPTSSDWIEGIVSLTPTVPTQLQIVTNDISLASTGSHIGANLNVGDPVQITLSGVQPFAVDSKGLPVVTTSFKGSSDATTIIPGQTVALHVTAFTAKSGTALAVATVDTVVLRFTRVTGANVSSVANPFFNIQSLPPFFAPAVTYQVQISNATPSTNYDGSPDTSTLSGANVSIRALYFGSSVSPAFSAAKVRKH